VSESPTGAPGGGRSSAETDVLDATERLLEAHTIHDLTVAQILDEAGLSRASFYKYFASKHDVLIALLRRIFAAVPGMTADLAPGVPPPRPRARLRQAMPLWAAHGAVNRAAVESMHVVPAVGEAWAEMLEVQVAALATAIRREREEGLAPDGPPAEALAAVLLDSVERTFYVASNGLDPRLPEARRAIDAIDALAAAAIYGSGALPDTGGGADPVTVETS